MVYSTYRFALLTFNLLCSIEAMKESFVGGDSVVDAYGAEDKGQKLQVSLGEHDTGHGETEDEANGEDVAFVEVTASGALTTIARPRNSSLVEAVQADEAESAGEAEEDEDAEESDEVDGATLTLTLATKLTERRCGVLAGKKRGTKKFVFCEKPSDSCTKTDCNAFCNENTGNSCENRKERVGESQIVSGWVCGDNGQKLQLNDPTGCKKDRNEAKKAKCTKIVTASAMSTEKSKQFNDPLYASCKTAGSECKECIDKDFQVYCFG